MTFIKKIFLPRYHFEMSKGKTWKVFVLLFVLSVLSSLVITYKINHEYKTLDKELIISEYNREIGCKVVDYKMICNEDYITSELDGFTIEYDKGFDSLGKHYFNRIIFTENEMYLYDGSGNTTISTYTDMFESNMKINDILEVIEGIFPTFIVIFFIGALIGHFIVNLIMLLIRAVILLIANQFIIKRDIEFGQFVRLSGYMVTPLILLNAVTMLLTYKSFTSLVEYFLYIPGWITYTLIFVGLYYLTKERKKNTGYDNVDELK